MVHLCGTLEKALFAGHTQSPLLKRLTPLSDPVSGDLDAEGEAVGVEVLGVSSADPGGRPGLPEAGALRDLLRPRAA